MPNFLEISDQNLGGKENYWEIGVSAQCLEQWNFFTKIVLTYVLLWEKIVLVIKKGQNNLW